MGIFAKFGPMIVPARPPTPEERDPSPGTAFPIKAG
jgi:hypothetical protein